MQTQVHTTHKCIHYDIGVANQMFYLRKAITIKEMNQYASYTDAQII